MTQSDHLVPADQLHRINQRLLKRFGGGADMDNIESAHRKVNVQLQSPDAKRLFIRLFGITQSNLHYATVIARTWLEPSMVEQVESEALQQLENINKILDNETAAAERKLRNAGVQELGNYHVPSLDLAVMVFSRYGKRYLELFGKFDHLMLMLETMGIDELLTHDDLNRTKARCKTEMRKVTAMSRALRNRCYRLVNEMLQKRTSGEREVSATRVVSVATTANEVSSPLASDVPVETGPTTDSIPLTGSVSAGVAPRRGDSVVQTDNLARDGE